MDLLQSIRRLNGAPDLAKLLKGVEIWTGLW
jgi:hypothetical protein